MFICYYIHTCTKSLKQWKLLLVEISIKKYAMANSENTQKIGNVELKKTIFLSIYQIKLPNLSFNKKIKNRFKTFKIKCS